MKSTESVSPAIDWQWASFAQLSNHDVYAMMAARLHVFVLEQQCLWNDFDGLDLDAHHVLGWATVDGQRQLVAYLRVLAPGAKYAEASIGRVLTTSAGRGGGIGRALVAQGLAQLARLYPGAPVKIGAQQYLERFYASFGFVTISAPYDEDGIMHVDMRL
ncbi:GNAT family N-acetyltransferase [Massilia sp. DWR3-1-1]|uniref:GNAT family N-acetyltransferase n=1 Tax=Massilia sp. DWR3-1-1 TaxID=2804559 RepID=UPI003CF8FA32